MDIQPTVEIEEFGIEVNTGWRRLQEVYRLNGLDPKGHVLPRLSPYQEGIICRIHDAWMAEHRGTLACIGYPTQEATRPPYHRPPYHRPSCHHATLPPCHRSPCRGGQSLMAMEVSHS